MLSKANSSIVRRLRELSHWFEPPIPRFGASAGVAMKKREGIGSASVQSFGSRSRCRLFALLGNVGWQHELKSRAAFGAGRGPEAAVVALDDRSANRQAHAHAVGLGREQRIENTIDDLRVDSLSSVRHGNQYPARFLDCRFD